MDNHQNFDTIIEVDIPENFVEDINQSKGIVHKYFNLFVGIKDIIDPKTNFKSKIVAVLYLVQNLLDMIFINLDKMLENQGRNFETIDLSYLVMEQNFLILEPIHLL